MGTPDNRRWWSYLRLSLRGLIVLVLIVGCGLGVIAHYIRSAAIQREAVAAIQKLNGFVLYDWQLDAGKVRVIPGTNTIIQKVPGWPKWLVDRLGPDFFGSVRQVSFRNVNSGTGAAGPSSKEIDDVLSHVGQLHSLTNLTFLRMPVTDSGLAHLEGLTSLQSLMFRGRNLVTDAGVAHLKKMTGLTHLNLEDSQVTDAGLSHLKDLTSLEGVNLAHAPVGDAGLAHLMGLPHLEWLGLEGTQVTDSGLLPLLRTRTRWTALYLSDTRITDTLLEAIEDTTSLRHLILRNTQVTDKGLAYMKRLTELQTLDLYGTQVSDAGLAHLTGLSKLQSLNVGATKITDPGLQELQRTLLKLKTFR